VDKIYFGECPRWHEGRLWFSDFFAHAVKSVSLQGDLRTEFEIDDQPSGLGWMPDGTMLIVSMAKQQVLRRSPNGTISVHAQLPDGGYYTNDMVVDPSGAAYVGNFGFDLEAEMLARGIPNVLENHPTARIVRVAPDGTIKIVAEDMHFPNGTVITPDGRTLIVAETLAGALTAFDIAPDGSLINRRPWASTWPRVPDGIALNADENIWIANVLAPECALLAEGGRVVEVVETDQPCYACMLGGDDGHTLFMCTAPTSLVPETDAPPLGKILIAHVDVPHAGLP
jgi:sugar lactone lactonase YvrE